MKKIQKEINEWQEKAFGSNQSHAFGLYHHLQEEVGEVAKAFYSVEKMAEELADCFIIIAGLADAFNVDLSKAVKDKMRKNKKRHWNHPDKQGIIRHKK